MGCNKAGAVAVLVSIIMLIAAAAPASASSVNVNVDTSNRTAVWHSQTQLFVNFTYPNSSALSIILNGTHGTLNLTITAHSNTSFSAAAVINSSLVADYQQASLSNLFLYYNASWIANQTELSVAVETSLLMTVSGIGNATAKSVNMSWKDFSYTGSLNVATNTTGTVDINSAASAVVYSSVANVFSSSSSTLSNYHMLNFSAFSMPLSSWHRSYDGAKRQTVYSDNAGVTLNRSFNITVTTHKLKQNYTLSLYMDPAAQIVTNGNTIASGNTLYVRSSSGIGIPSYLVAGAVIVVLVGGVLAVLVLKKRKKG